MVFGASAGAGQDLAPPLVQVDSVEIRTDNVFTDSAAAEKWVYRTANSLRFATRDNVVRRELLFRPNEPFDPALLTESERLLRMLELFRSVSIDTVRDGDGLVAVVETRDAWSTNPIFSVSFASDGTLTGRIGITERNLLGMGNLVSVAYRRTTERDGVELETSWRRLFDSQIDVSGEYARVSDGTYAAWAIGDPWRSFDDEFSLRFDGGASDLDRYQYRVESATLRDTTIYRRHYFAQNVRVGIAPVATPTRVVRLEATARVRNERFLLGPAPAMVPDSIFADFGAFVTYDRPEFEVVQYLDGLNKQDVDLTTGITFGARLAPEIFGYARTGIAPAMSARLGTKRGRLLLRASLLANGQFSSAGLDSGRVVGSVSAGVLLGNLHSTLINLRGGVLDAPAPGAEFDLGFSAPPRSFEPHAFVGTRGAWGTVEHRWYALPDLFEQFGAAFAAYFDFGGAWYRGQDARWGGEIGAGIRLSSRLGPRADTNRIDVGYRLGENFEGNRWVISLGTGFAFF